MFSSVKLIAMIMAITTLVLPNEYTFLSNTSSPEEMQRIFDLYTPDTISNIEQDIAETRRLMKTKAALNVSDTYIAYVASAMHWCEDFKTHTQQIVNANSEITNTLLDMLVQYRIQQCR
jgi:hypothetical protein